MSTFSSLQSAILSRMGESERRRAAVTLQRGAKPADRLQSPAIQVQIELPLRVLFDMPTIIDMTIAIAARQVELEDADEVAQMLEDLPHLSPEAIAALLADEEEGI